MVNRSIPLGEYMLSCYPNGTCFNNGQRGYVAKAGLRIVTDTMITIAGVLG
jgi:type IV secretory pathway protease TraF